MKTTNERIIELEKKIDDVLKAVSPQEDVADNSINISKQLNDFKDDLLDMLNSKVNNECISDLEEDNSGKFVRNMWNYAVGGFLISAILTALTYKFILFFFPLAFSLFFVFSLVGLSLLHDKFLLPGNTIKRISNNAIASSIFWLAFTIASVAGFSIGNSIISDPFGGEERSRTAKASQERYIETTPAPNGSTKLRLDSGGASEE